MTAIHTTIAAPQRRVPVSISRAFASVWAGLIALSERQPHMQKINALQAKTDDELAAMGLRREDITRVVFSDKFYL